MLSKSVIDLFATRLNKQIDMYWFWHPDLDAFYVNAFSFLWKDIYINPTFSLIGRTRMVRKICQDQSAFLWLQFG